MFVMARRSRLGELRRVVLCRGGLGIVRCGKARYGWVRFCYGKARRSRRGVMRHGGSGGARSGQSRRSRQGKFWFDGVWSVGSRHGGRGTVR